MLGTEEHEVPAVSRSTRLGAIAWLLGAAQFLAAHLVVQWAWPQPYSWSANNVSDLGAVECGDWAGRYICSPLHGVMNASFVLQGVAFIAGALLVRTLWRRGAVASWGAGVLLAVAGAGWIIVGLAPADVQPQAHSAGALLLAAGNVGLVLAGLGARAGALRPTASTALVLGLVGVAATVLFMTGIDLGLGLGGMERFWILPAQIWTVLAGAVLLLAREGVMGTPARRGPRRPRRDVRRGA
ncbi:DUF998 domain-containing protein [Marinitenerispora sediminis]|uniref:DUF998 domain-containing protein n=1 Tax=Marinitenerispora sediminis TaxID=1931232 RepID=UPI0013148451|nr:DUF998 domain-containing protein [Marinitenerispora sediminis]